MFSRSRRSVVLVLALVVATQALSAQEQSWSAEIETSVRTAFTGLLHSFIRIVPRLIATALTLAVFWAVAALIRRLATVALRAVPNPTLRHLAKQIAWVSVWAIGVVVVIGQLGFDPQAVATAVGLTGIAIGFALKDVMSNLVSGLLILLMRSFEIGDQIIIGDTEGTVERIEVRVTQIRTYDGRLVLVPNAEIFSSRVINNTASPLRRSSVIVLLGYEQDLRLALETMAAATSSTPGVANEPAPSVRLRDLAPGHVALEARFWADARRADYMNTTCHVRAAIVQALKSAGVALPNPDTRVLSPGNLERWRAVFEGRAEAQLS